MNVVIRMFFFQIIISPDATDCPLTLSPPTPLRLYTLPYWSNPPFLIFDIRALWTERQSARMSVIKNGGLDHYGAEPFEQQQFGTAGVEGVNTVSLYRVASYHRERNLPSRMSGEIRRNNRKLCYFRRP